ncbi:hypothetical protein QEH56_14305 [Pelagicoccus enzymogenes]|uniref:type II secretion system protein n=1 Tax=Pelagicoccus enzymogenes TaxID=2773457 RepID=UPI00280C60C8|nr:hypothetical protein [Pelagicoccus enzymogenes]MDQ8199338.1 hypothetical protein [Pelagicoccus enzymogenes]
MTESGACMRHGEYGRAAFSLLEVVVALAMLALIAIPAVGLATMAASGSKEKMTAGHASELKSRIDTALRSHASIDILDDNYDLSGGGKVFWGSSNLLYIEPEGSLTQGKNDQYFKVRLREADGDTYSNGDPFRFVVYEVTWPENTQDTRRYQLFFPAVFKQ